MSGTGLDVVTVNVTVDAGRVIVEGGEVTVLVVAVVTVSVTVDALLMTSVVVVTIVSVTVAPDAVFDVE